MKIINIADAGELAVICAQLVQQGVTFEACASSLTVTLTGGY